MELHGRGGGRADLGAYGGVEHGECEGGVPGGVAVGGGDEEGYGGVGEGCEKALRMWEGEKGRRTYNGDLGNAHGRVGRGLLLRNLLHGGRDLKGRV